MTEPVMDSLPNERNDDATTEWLARERLYIRRIDELEAKVQSLQSAVLSLSVKSESISSTLDGHEMRMDRLRIDKQVLGLPRWLIAKLFRRDDPEATKHHLRQGSSSERLLILAPKYPSLDAPYGGQPVERRVRNYVGHGFDVTVFVPEAREELRENRDGVIVVRGFAALIPELISEFRIGQICIHHPVPELWDAIRPYTHSHSIHVWIHGYEARDWRSLQDNFSDEELRAGRLRLDALQVERQRVLTEIFQDERVTKIFVSEFMQGVAEDFAGVKARNTRIIHNVVDTSLFGYSPKGPEMRSKILVVRSFAARNYGTDMIRPVIELLSESETFGDLQFEIRGDGRHFLEDTKGLGRFENVDVIKGILSPSELRERFSNHGIFLNPTRWDSQGMTAGEAMASGLVPVTNRVAAIPEFVDEDSGMIASDESIYELAAGIQALHEDPDLFVKKSQNAAQRARAQVGPEATVEVEVELLRNNGIAP